MAVLTDESPISIIGNVCSAVGLVIINKRLAVIDGFKYMSVLGCLHFYSTMRYRHCRSHGIRDGEALLSRLDMLLFFQGILRFRTIGDMLNVRYNLIEKFKFNWSK
jgi:hypothetical protein